MRRLFLAEDTGLEPAGLLHLTRFPGELLSHSVNPPSRLPNITNNRVCFKWNIPTYALKRRLLLLRILMGPGFLTAGVNNVNRSGDAGDACLGLQISNGLLESGL